MTLKRAALHVLLAYVAIVGAPRVAKAQELPFVLTQVGPSVWAAISNPTAKSPAWANVGFVIGDDSVVVIDATNSTGADGNFDPEPARLLLAAICSLTTLPVTFVINTHHHVDHVGGNEVFANAGAVVLSHKNVREWIRTENLKLLGKDITPPQTSYIEALLPPMVTYDRAVDLYLGSRRVIVQSLPGHTGSDSVVLIPDARVVFTGDLFWRNTQPTLIDASTNVWVDTLDTLLKNEAGATFVPGHGDVGTSKDVAAFREYLVTLRTLVSNAQITGHSGMELAEMVMPVLARKYENWDTNKDELEYFARRNILEVESELNGTKRVPREIQHSQ
jgi:glyoxylase-like metal-dependent hydrolase (beta-lactamase superfamily II)